MDFILYQAPCPSLVVFRRPIPAVKNTAPKITPIHGFELVSPTLNMVMTPNTNPPMPSSVNMIANPFFIVFNFW